jgi:type IV secretion system protein VirD4
MVRKDVIVGVGAVFVALILAISQSYNISLSNYLPLVAQRILSLGLVIGLSFVFGTMFSPKLAGIRRWLLLGFVFVAVLFSLIIPSEMADWVGYPVKIIAAFIAFGIGLSLGAKALAAARHPTSYGSAKWATFDYLTEHGLLSETGFLLGDFRDAGGKGRLHYEGARHLLTVAPTRSGKGVSSIIPNLLLHRGSALVIDPKGENALITAKRRGNGDAAAGIEGLGQHVILLDPWDIAASRLGLTQARFNPLDWIRAGDPDAVENAFILADALVLKESGSDSAFWGEEAKALLTGIILYVATAADEALQRHLGRVRDILTLEADEFKDVLQRMYNHPNPLVSSTAARTASKDIKLRSSVLASAQAHTHFLESPRIRASLSASDFAFEDLKAEAVTVYLILPADRLSTFNRWLRLLIQQAITVNARNIGTKPKTPILFMLDEMPTLGRLPSLEQAFGLMAGFGMQLWGIVQDLSQLANTYGEHGWQTFISNSGVIQYFGSRDKMTAEYFSALCGVTTVEVRNFSWAVSRAISWSSSHSSGAGGGSSSSGRSTNDSRTNTVGVSEAQRHLAYADELMVLKGNEQIVFVENLDPIRGEKLPWYKDDLLRKFGRDLHQTSQ